MALPWSSRTGMATARAELWPSIAGSMMAPRSASAPIGASRAIRTASTTPVASIPRELSLRNSSIWSKGSGPAASIRSYSISTSLSKPRRTLSAPIRPQVTSQPPRTIQVQFLSQQRLFTSGISRNLLANREEAANRNPGSATAQNAFYQVLLKANMPAIVVERYQSGRFASNDATLEAYQRALGMMSGAAPGAVAAQALSSPGMATGHNPAHLQAVGQAVAAHARGGSAAVAKESAGGPIHVVINESRLGNFFRWVKFFAWFSLIAYVCLVALSIVFDVMTTWKKPGSNKVGGEVKAEKQTTRFSDVHGCEEAKEELQELVEFLRNPERFSTLGGKLPKGVLLVGPPGTGKTLLARAVAGEAGVPFHYMSGSEFDEVYVGVGARRVRDLFTSAKSHAPAIVFIDEIDAIGGRRNTRDAAYVKQTLNQLLTELDGFNQDSGVIVIGATNFPELLDKALTRPGRFDRHVQVDLPDVRGRIAILKHHAKKIKAAKDVNLEAIAMSTSGLSGAELESIVNQAAVHASRSKASLVTTKDFDWAKDKVIMGAEKKTMVINPKEKLMTAYHEAGHALINYYSNSPHKKLYKVTILPRGQSLGHTAYLPQMDTYSVTAKDYLHDIESCLGGKIAEQLAYGTGMTTSGVASDLERATAIAYAMVARFGMSEKLGPMEYHARFENLSGQTKALIESEVQKTLIEAQERGIQLLTEKRKELDLLAKALVEYETLDVKEVEKVIRGEELVGRTKMPAGSLIVRPQPQNPLDGITPFPGGGGRRSGEGDAPSPPPPPPPPPQAPPPASGRERS